VEKCIGHNEVCFVFLGSVHYKYSLLSEILNVLHSRCLQKYMCVFKQSVRYHCPILTKRRICQQKLLKQMSIKFHEHLLSGSRFVCYVLQMDGWSDFNSLCAEM
jgi:hypothetical protein